MTPDPRAQLIGICEGYLTCAGTHEALFQLIVSQDITQDEQTELSLATHSSFRVLADTRALFEPSPNHPQGIEMMVWSLIHGFTSLGKFHRAVPPTSDQSISFADILPPLTPDREN